MKPLGISVYFLACLLAFASCSNIDDKLAIDLKPFPEEGIMLTIQNDQLTYDSIKSRPFYVKSIYTIPDIYYEYERLGNEIDTFRSQIINAPYSTYFETKNTTQPKSSSFKSIDSKRVAFNSFEIILTLKEDYRKEAEIERIKGEILQDPLQIKITKKSGKIK